MDTINRLDISYNDALKVKVTTEEDMPKRDLQMRALEAILTDMTLDATAPGDDPLPAIRDIFASLLEDAPQPEQSGAAPGAAAGAAPDDAPAPRALPEETLIERFKRYYVDYRAAAGPDEAFKLAFEALTYSAIDLVDVAADRADIGAVRAAVREYREIRSSVQGSNDSVKERFEREFRENALTR